MFRNDQSTRLFCTKGRRCSKIALLTTPVLGGLNSLGGRPASIAEFRGMIWDYEEGFLTSSTSWEAHSPSRVLGNGL